VVCETNPDSCDDGLVFDIEPVPDRVAIIVLDQGLRDLLVAQVGIIFDKDPKHDEAELGTG
jgi:hypothetical protein